MEKSCPLPFFFFYARFPWPRPFRFLTDRCVFRAKLPDARFPPHTNKKRVPPPLGEAFVRVSQTLDSYSSFFVPVPPDFNALTVELFAGVGSPSHKRFAVSFPLALVSIFAHTFHPRTTSRDRSILMNSLSITNHTVSIPIHNFCLSLSQVPNEWFFSRSRPRTVTTWYRKVPRTKPPAVGCFSDGTNQGLKGAVLFSQSPFF